MLELPGFRRGLIVPIPSSRHLPPRPVKPNHFVVRRTAPPVKKPGLSLTERACLATMAAVAAKRIAVHHGEKLPDEYACRIPKTDSEILNFFLSFLAHQGLKDVPVFVNGGYVRDLLLGKEPDDLDLTLCLRDCPEEVTVAALLDEMKGYVESRPELGITEFKNATILSNESKDKQLDTFKAHFTNKDGVKTEVDVMPTIGEEKYSEDNRIPERDQRGLPEEDALRRDLTIGALLLRVQRTDGSDALEYELFDFYGGVDDICKGMLRSPCPVNKTLDEVAEIVLRTDEERELAKILKIKDLPPEEAVQILWWSKVLIDDPLRICRAFRFAAKFKFELHPAFWMAVPFALDPLAAVLAPTRVYRMLKLAFTDSRLLRRKTSYLVAGALLCQLSYFTLKLPCSLAAQQTRRPASTVMADEKDHPMKPRAALLLIDMQKAFTTGSWACHFGGPKEVSDIRRACGEAAQLLGSGRLPPETPVLCTKCYTDGEDEPYLDTLEPLLRKYPCIHKPTMDVTYNPAFFRWLRKQAQQGIGVLVIGGCTTTSCVRVSSTRIAGQLEEQGLSMKVVVDLNLCGARQENFEHTAHYDPVLVGIYGREFCKGKSAVDLAIVQMKRAGVEVLEGSAGCMIARRFVRPHPAVALSWKAESRTLPDDVGRRDTSEAMNGLDLSKDEDHAVSRHRNWPLRTKVAGSRKFTEYHKIGGYGFKACSDFFELAFSRTFGPGEGSLRLASALLGGQDGKGQARMLSQVKSFNVDVFRELAETVKPQGTFDGVELLGELMAAAVAAAEFEGVEDAASQLTKACDGMCVSNAMREAGLSPWRAYAAMMSEPPLPNSLDCRVAEACGISPASLAQHTQVWDAMQICNARTGPEYSTEYRRNLALALVGLQHKDGELQKCFKSTMPTWKELLGKTLAPTCEPKVKLHFQDRRQCDVHDPMFLRCLTVFARSRGCKIVNAQLQAGQQQEFSVVMCHDNIRDLDNVPAPSNKKGKKLDMRRLGPSHQLNRERPLQRFLSVSLWHQSCQARKVFSEVTWVG
eukprot:s26_g57.t1